MKVTLKKAADLARGAAEAANLIEVNSTVRVSIFSSPVDIPGLQVALTDRINTKLALIDAQYWLRQRIGEENAKNGVDTHLSQRARLDSQIKELASILSGMKVALSEENDPEASVRERTALLLQQDKADLYPGYREKAVTFRVADQAMLDNLTQRLAALKRQRSDFTDRVAGLNLSTMIVLPDDVVKTLAGAGLIEV